jgi:hypothetical protein
MPTEEAQDCWQEAFSRLRILAASLPLERTTATHDVVLWAELSRGGIVVRGRSKERLGLRRESAADAVVSWSEVVQSSLTNPFGPALVAVCTKLGVPHAYR